MISGHSDSPFMPRWIDSRSDSADVVPNAQHDPQYCGMCWFLASVA